MEVLQIHYAPSKIFITIIYHRRKSNGHTDARWHLFGI